jgi:hypothetical protein
MIAKDSTSYPFLAVAVHYGIPYATVLEYVGHFPSATLQRSEKWQIAAWNACVCEQARRKGS